MTIIALEEHFWTPGIRDANLALPKEIQDSSLLRAREGLDEKLLDLGEGRLKRMDDAGVDIAVLSASSPATQSLSPEDAVPIAREANDLLHAATRAYPERLLGFATLPTPDPKAAAEELRRCVGDLGFKGAMINGRTGDRPLDHPDFRPIFAAAAELEVPIYIHPQTPPPAVRDLSYGGFDPQVSALLASSGWGWHIETAVQALRLILAGTFDRHPGLQMILGHWGEVLPIFLERVDKLSDAETGLDRRVADYFTQNFHVTPGGIYSERMLLHCLQAVGADRILFATDDPFVPTAKGVPRTFLESAPISPADREKIASGNAKRLLRL